MKNGKGQGFTLTSPAGHFIFDSDVKIGDAKLVRDFLTTMVMDPGAERPPSELAAPKYVKAQMNGPAKDTAFVWIKEKKNNG